MLTRDFVRAGLAGLVLAGGLFTSGPTLAAVEAWTVDTGHSNCLFKVRHFFTPVTGRFTDFAGTLNYDAEAPEKSSVEIVIQATSINTDNENRDKHLRTDDFFNVEAYPTITFKSTKVEKTDKANHFKVTGDLTLRDVTKPVTLDVEVLGFGPDAWGGSRGGFVASGVVNRLDYGVKWNKALDSGGAMLGDEVTIDFGVEVMKKKI